MLLPRPRACRDDAGHPAVVRRLNWIIGAAHREIAEPMLALYPPGTPGGHLHSDADTGPGCNVLWAFHPEVTFG